MAEAGPVWQDARTAAGGAIGAPAAAGALVRFIEAEQGQWFLWLPVLFGAGVAGYFLLAFEPPWQAVLPVAAAVLVLHVLAPREGSARVFTTALVALAAGVVLAKARTQAVAAPVIARESPGIEVTGVIELIEPRVARGERLTLRVLTLSRLPPEQWPYRVRVRTLAANPDLRPGMAVAVKATLSPPAAPALPGGFDFARTAWYSALGGVGFSTGRADVIARPADASLRQRVVLAIEDVREGIGRRIVAALPGEPGAIANALITGERGGITDATNQAFRNSGLFHILSISGLHMVVMAGAVFGLVRFCLALVPPIALRFPIKKWAAVSALAGALAYLLISGSSPATVRSYIMISIMFFAVLLDRPALALRNVALAALAILVIYPESLLDAGFQMSFAAVVALISGYEALLRRREGAPSSAVRGLVLFFGGIVLSTLIASAAVTPFGIYHFHNTQQFAILANLIAIPLCNVVVMPAALATLVAMPFGLEAWPLAVMGLGIEGMTWVARTVGGLPGSVWRVPAVSTLSFALMLAGGLWLTLWRTRWRLAGLVAIAAGIGIAPFSPRPDVLVGREGALVAVRAADGLLSARAQRGATYDLSRWLEYDGDARTAAAAARADAFHCDRQGCLARVHGLRLAIADGAEALRDDCPAADIVVLRLKGACPAGAPRPRLVLDERRLQSAGAHALFIEQGRIRVETVAGLRGVRPWTPAAGEEAGRSDGDPP